MDSYQALSARVYDFDKPIGTSFGDIEFYTDRLRLHQVESNILEPAVGTGRFMIPLLDAGFQVQGFDLSLNMLSICENHLKQDQYAPSLVQHASFTDFHYPEPFNAIVIPSGTFLLMTDNSSIDLALTNFHQHLVTGGMILFDIFLQPSFKVGKTTIKQYPLTPTQKITLTMTESDIDYINQVTTTYHRYEEWDNQELVKTELEVFQLKWLGIQEVKLLLMHHGFINIEFFADYDVNKPLSNTSEIITVSAIKK